jgi:hypothetical protein
MSETIMSSNYVHIYAGRRFYDQENASVNSVKLKECACEQV